MNCDDHYERIQDINCMDSLATEIRSIKKTLKGWTKIFTQIMELQVQNSKSQNQNTLLIQQILEVLPKSIQITKEEKKKISPIRKIIPKTEPDDNFFAKLEHSEIFNCDNLQNVLNNPHQMQIVNYQGTPFDSAYESINREMQQLYEPEHIHNQPTLQTEQSSDGLKFHKPHTQQLRPTLITDGISLPQSTKNNNTERRQFVFNSTKNLPQFQQESKENQKPIKDQKKMKIKEQKLSTVVEEVSTLQNSQFINKQFGPTQPIVQSCQNRNSNGNTCFEFQVQLQQSISKTPNNNTKPQNYFIENQRSASKSLYSNQQAPQSYKNTNNNPIIPTKYEQISSRAKSFSDQNSKRHPSKKCLDLDFIDRQFDQSQEILKKTNTMRKT